MLRKLLFGLLAVMITLVPTLAAAGARSEIKAQMASWTRFDDLGTNNRPVRATGMLETKAANGVTIDTAVARIRYFEEVTDRPLYADVDLGLAGAVAAKLKTTWKAETTLVNSSGGRGFSVELYVRLSDGTFANPTFKTK